MSTIELYNLNALACSKSTTNRYSTSFLLGIKLLGSEMREAVYAIYGLVRVADEIVDTLHNHNNLTLLTRFRNETFTAIKEGISTNPIIQSFQITVNQYGINSELIEAFFDSMAMDLDRKAHDKFTFKNYIYGSAEVVGLMCLRVFYQNDTAGYEALKHPARKLGEAFQKVNFLRDIQADHQELGRTYFPNVDLVNFSFGQKTEIEEEIEADFKEAFKGIVQLKKEARLGVYIAYLYYQKLFRKIKRTPPEAIMRQRIRVSNFVKMGLLLGGVLRHELGQVNDSRI
jgi:phytoene synthase